MTITSIWTSWSRPSNRTISSSSPRTESARWIWPSAVIDLILLDILMPRWTASVAAPQGGQSGRGHRYLPVRDGIARPEAPGFEIRRRRLCDQTFPRRRSAGPRPHPHHQQHSGKASKASNMLIGMELHEKPPARNPDEQPSSLAYQGEHSPDPEGPLCQPGLPALPGTRRSISWGRTAWSLATSSTRTTGARSRKR